MMFEEDAVVTRPLLRGDSQEEKRSLTDGDVDIEHALETVGYGSVHFLVMAVCAWGCTSDAVEVVCISFILPSAECDLQLSSSDKGLLNAIIFLGMMIGGFFWGAVSDTLGRKSILTWSLAINGIASASSSLAPNFSMFLLLRLLSGIGVGGSYPVIFSYFTEWQPRNYRGAAVSSLSCCWMFGGILTAGAAWLLVPHPDWKLFSIGDLQFTSWRLFLVVCSIPSISSAAIFPFLPESPKYLLQMGMDIQTTEYMNKLAVRYGVTSRSAPKLFSRVFLNRGGSDVHFTAAVAQASSRCDSVRRLAKGMISSLKSVFAARWRRHSLTLIFVNFALAFGYYGLLLWFPELFKRVERFGGSPCSLGNASLNGTSNSGIHCNKTSLTSPTIYWEAFVVNSANLPGNILSVLIIDKVGRRLLLSFSMVCTALSVFLVTTIATRTQFLLVSCAFAGLSAAGWNALGVIATELLPTHLRSTTIGVSQGLSRIAAIAGNLVFGFLVDSSCAIPLFLASAFLLVGGLVSLKFPNTTKKDIV